jgi:alkylation response protein AidB-like acyl-CoA dehydrogenase
MAVRSVGVMQGRPSIDFVPPLKDMWFVLDEIVDVECLARSAGFEQAEPEVLSGVLSEAARFVAEVVAPLNRPGDEQHSRRNPDGTVSTPDGFAPAYQRYVAAGWGSVPFPAEYGGGGFPWLVATVLGELLAAACLSFSLCPTLTQGAIELILAHGDDEQRERFLPRMVTGEWTGTMNLTEPDAGSDLGGVRTRAVAAGDGTWRITGQKIFITYGDHDLAENIVHLVLARVPDAPPGTRGISCFIVPKWLLDANGRPAERNRMTCLSLENKLGIHASPTCTLEFDDAEGYLIGEPNQGMRYMFTMMNNARLCVGVQGLAIAERAYQQAVAYARERHQGRAPGAAAGTSSAIIDHPDVRRMLMTQRASIEALRSLAYLLAESMDLAAHHPDANVRDRRRELVELLTPVTKGWGTDLGVELTSLALQVHGGAGYIEETGVAQHVRDARITPIYEGTNGIQAIDLVTRKVPIRGGAAIRDLMDEMDAIGHRLGVTEPDMAPIGVSLVGAVAVLREATDWVKSADTADALAGATPYLRLFGVVLGGWLMARQALAAAARLGSTPADQAGFYDAKIATARFYCTQLLPQAHGLLPAVTAGCARLVELAPDQF